MNVAAVARECQLERKTVAGYFGILEDLLIAFRLPVFSRRAKRKLMTHEKFYFFDPGVFRALRPQGPLDSSAELDGAALETLVVQHVRALNDYLGLRYRLHFWHTADHRHEVDLVLYGPRGLCAYEIKRGARLRDEDLASLRAFKSDYPMATAILLYGGTETTRIHGVYVIPVGDGVRRLGELMARPLAP